MLEYGSAEESHALQVSEVYSLLASTREDVRVSVIQIIAGLSLDDSGATHALLARDPERFVAPLVAALGDVSEVAAHAWDALTNFAAGDVQIAGFVADTALDRILAALCAPSSIFADAASRLLCNITKHPRKSLDPEALLPVLVRMLCVDARHNPNCSFDYCACSLADLTTLPAGRKYFLDGIENGTDQLTAVLLPALQGSELRDSSSPRACIRRGAAASAIKNCLFDADKHEAILDREQRATAEGAFFLIAALCSRLFSPEAELSQAEIDALPLELQLFDRRSEPDRGIRAIIVECLILMGTTRRGRDCMRAKAIYPILREWHRVETEDSLRELIERIVELLIRDEDQQ